MEDSTVAFLYTLGVVFLEPEEELPDEKPRTRAGWRIQKNTHSIIGVHLTSSSGDR
jgi:hypothetical protein